MFSCLSFAAWVIPADADDRSDRCLRVMVNTGGGEAAEWSGQAIDASANARLAAHPIGRNDGWNDAKGANIGQEGSKEKIRNTRRLAAPFDVIKQGNKEGRAHRPPQALSSSPRLLRDRLTGAHAHENPARHTEATKHQPISKARPALPAPQKCDGGRSGSSTGCRMRQRHAPPRSIGAARPATRLLLSRQTPERGHVDGLPAHLMHEDAVNLRQGQGDGFGWFW